MVRYEKEDIFSAKCNHKEEKENLVFENVNPDMLEEALSLIQGKGTKEIVSDNPTLNINLQNLQYT